MRERQGLVRGRSVGRIPVLGHRRQERRKRKLDYLVDLAAGGAQAAEGAAAVAAKHGHERQYDKARPRRADGVQLPDDLPPGDGQVDLLERLAEGRVEQVGIAGLGLAAGEGYLAGMHAQAGALSDHWNGRPSPGAAAGADRHQDGRRAGWRHARRAKGLGHRPVAAAGRRADRRREQPRNSLNVHAARGRRGRRVIGIAIKGFNGGRRGRRVAIGYEVNPPRLPADSPGEPRAAEAARLLEGVERRISDLSGSCPRCDAVHVTESVLGTRRLSPIATARRIGEIAPRLSMTVTMRTRGRSLGDAIAFAGRAASEGVGGILVVMGDPPRGGADAGGAPGRPPPLAPSRAAAGMRGAAAAAGIDLFLSAAGPAAAGDAAMRAKIAARPAGFFTQVVSSVEEVARIRGSLAPMGFRVVPIVLVPSEANRGSAKFLGLDWSGYERDPAGFIGGVHAEAGDVLVTSPSDFAAARDALASL